MRKKIQFSRFCCQYEFFLCNFQSSLILLCGPGWRAIVVGEILYIFSTLCTRCAMREAKRRNEQDKRYFHLARALAKCTNFQSTTFLRAECFVAWFLRCRVASCPHMDFSFWFSSTGSLYFFLLSRDSFQSFFPYDFSEWRHFRSQAERAIVGDLTARALNTGFLSYPLYYLVGVMKETPAQSTNKFVTFDTAWQIVRYRQAFSKVKRMAAAKRVNTSTHIGFDVNE